MGCATGEKSQAHADAGVIDGHAYAVLACIKNAGGTQFHMIQVRNPWGHAELKSGRWCDGGSGWTEFPRVADVCRHADVDDGIFWMDSQEFFRFFPTLYVCALDMSAWVKQR